MTSPQLFPTPDCGHEVEDRHGNLWKCRAIAGHAEDDHVLRPAGPLPLIHVREHYRKHAPPRPRQTVTVPDPTALPTVALARTSAPGTSHQAARSVNLGRRHAALLVLFERWGPMHDEQLIDRYPNDDPAGYPLQSVSSIRSRRSELVRAGRLVEVGRATTRAGRACRVFAPSTVTG